MWRLATKEEKEYIIKNRINNEFAGAWGPLIFGCIGAFCSIIPICIFICVDFSLSSLLLLFIPVIILLLGILSKKRIEQKANTRVNETWDKEIYVIEGEFIKWKFRQGRKHNKKYAIIKTDAGEYTVEDDISSEYIHAKYDTAPHKEQVINDSRMIIYCYDGNFEKMFDIHKLVVPYAEVYKNKKQCS